MSKLHLRGLSSLPTVVHPSLMRPMGTVRFKVCLLGLVGICGIGSLRAEDNVTPELVLRDMLAAYEKVTTYSDTGMLMTITSSERPFTTRLKTWFARPHYFRLEVLSPSDHVRVAWSDGETHRVWDFASKSDPGLVEMVPFGKLLVGMNQYDIPSLLDPKVSGASRLNQLSSPVMLPKESVEGVECFHLKGTLRSDRYEVWIGASDRLIRKIKHWWHDYIFEELHHDIVVNAEISPATFDFRPPDTAVKH